MPRNDLLALSEDDLAAMTNRGTVKRALRELDEESVQAEIEESASGHVKVVWSNGIVCELPADAALSDAHCSSGSGGISRHLVRSVFAYQRWMQRDGQAPAEPSRSWDPGSEISDEMLAELFRKQDLSRAKQRFNAGVLVELVRSAKPVARFIDDPCTLRFMVPRDARYVHADCSAQALSIFVPMAVWAFRELPADQDAGLISIQLKSLPVPEQALASIETSLLELAEEGVAGVGPVWTHKLTRLENACREEGLIWPAEILAELATEHQRYHQHDAAFSIDRVVDLVAELLIRSDAIRSDRGELPQLLVRGTRSDKLADVGSSRFVGLGCGVRTTRKSAIVTAYMQDVDTGNLMAIEREFANASDDASERAFATLASTPIMRGITLAGIGSGQLLIKSGKRSPSCRLTLPRTGVSLNPQGFAWEKLRPPALVESFSELTSLLALLPPKSLRPRRVTEDIYVFAIQATSNPHFDSSQQAVVATLHDAEGSSATLLHRHNSRSAAGTEALLVGLGRGENVRFVSGRARTSSNGLLIEPISVVIEQDGQRTAIQPWIDDRALAPTEWFEAASISPAAMTSLASILNEWKEAMGELWLSGVARVPASAITSWNEVAERLESVGFLGFSQASRRLYSELSRKSLDLHWTSAASAGALMKLSMLNLLTTQT